MAKNKVSTPEEQIVREGENLFQALFDDSADAYLILEDNIFVDCNQATVKMLRANNKEEVLSMHPSQLSPEFQPDGRSSAEKAEEMIQVALEEGSNRFEWIHRRMDGEDFPVEVLLTSIRLEDRTILHTVWRDISGRMQTEQILRDSEERYRNAIAAAEAIPYYIDYSTETYQFIGEKIENLTGYRPDEITPTLLGEMIQETIMTGSSSGTEREDAIEKTRAGKILEWKADYRLLDRNGKTHWLSDASVQVLDPQGQAIGAVGILQDITDRKLAEAKALESQQILQSFLNNFPDSAFVTDVEGHFLMVNRYAAENIFGGTADELLGKTVKDIFPAELADDIYTSERQLLTTGETLVIEEKVPEANGQVRDKLTTKFLLFDAEGNINGLGGVLIDITERKKLEQQIQTAYERRGFQVQISTEISQEISRAAELTELFHRVVTLTKERLGYYHTQLLRFDPGQDAVVLVSGYGKTGEQMLEQGHRMAMGVGLIGTAAATGKTVLRPNLVEDHDWQPNPLLPETRGEIAVPIKLGDEILGVLDVQSDQADLLSDDDRLLLEGLCGQIAIAMDQTRLRQEMENRIEELNRLYQTMSREGWRSYRDTTSLPEGFLFDRENLHSLEEVEMVDDLFTHIPVSLPGGQILGEMAIADDPRNPLSVEDKNFLEQVSEQVALALESARLTQQTEQALSETQSLYRFSDHISSASDLDAIYQVVTRMACEEVGFTGSWLSIYEPENHTLRGVAGVNMPEDMVMSSLDINSLTPATLAAQMRKPVIVNHPENDERMREIPPEVLERMGKALAIPVLIGQELVGVISVTRETGDDIGEREERIIQIAADQLAIAMERNQLFEQTQKRAAELATVSELGTTITTILDTQEMLETVVNLAKERFNLYHAHIYMVDADEKNLVLAAGAGEVGRQMVSEGWKISLDAETSLVSKAARQREGVIVNNVKNEPDFMKNPLLPDTASEMAVPLITGGQVLGVLDVQSDKPGYFTEEDVSIQTTLASQVAVALQNAETYARTQRQAEHEALINVISQRIQSTTNIENALQVAIRELGRALGAKRTSVQLGGWSGKK